MNSKRSIQTLAFAAALTASLAASPVLARGGGFYDYARVVDVEPIVHYVKVPETHQECWEEEVAYRDGGSRRYTPIVVGSVLGGVAGNQVGKGRGRDAATVAGALLGAAIAHDLHDRPSRVHYDTVERCRDVTRYREEERIDGYRVTYRYKGETYTTRTDHDPGDRIRVRVDVRPVH